MGKAELLFKEQNKWRAVRSPEGLKSGEEKESKNSYQRKDADARKHMQEANRTLWSQGDPLTHLEFLSNTGENTSKKLSFASLLEGTELSKVGSTLLNARLFTGSDNIS